jgi:ABC-type uncharacterized transport system permease subunit
MATTLFWVAVALYALAGAVYLASLLGLPDRLARGARWVLVAAFAVHMLEIGARGIAGMHPVTSVREAMGFVAWMLTGGFLLAQVRWRLDAAGAFVAPASAALLLTARLTPASEPTSGLGVLGRIHIFLASIGVSVFALATALAILYLLEERQLKRKKLGAIVERGTALETLDRLSHRWVQVGFPIFTIAMITGAIWSARRSDGLRPEYAIAFFAWTAFAALLVMRVTAGWRGRRAAILTLIGFAASLTVLGIYLVRAIW